MGEEFLAALLSLSLSGACLMGLAEVLARLLRGSLLLFHPEPMQTKACKKAPFPWTQLPFRSQHARPYLQV